MARPLYSSRDITTDGEACAAGHPVAAMVQHCCRLLRFRLEKTEGCAGLVVGCGSGDEVVYLRHSFHSRRIFGVDIGEHFSRVARADGAVIGGDALRLPFRGASFDFAAAFHSLEHVGSPPKAVAEIARVLRPGGWFYAGVPNRNRVLGYVGSFDASTWQKISWNLKDWRARVAGRFRNEAGAHAGFTRNQLIDLLGACFSEIQLITEDFLRFKYAGRIHRSVLNLLLSPSLIDFSAPAHYAICRTPMNHC